MRIDVLVKPGSKKGPLVQENVDGSLTVFVRERAVDGRANDAVVALVAKHFSVPKTSVSIFRGCTSRQKVLLLAQK